MERRAHRSSSNSDGNSGNGISRMQQDLASSPHKQYLNEANGTMNGTMIRRVLPTGRKPHVCIVGAGVSGLRCADILLQAGLRVTILEARNRYGGRLCQALHRGNLVDLGPNWIHGTEDNPILDLAKETGTITHAWDGRQSIYNPQGEPLSENGAAEAAETVWSIIGDAMTYSRENSASIPASRSLLDFIKEKTKEVYLNSTPDEKKRELLLKVSEMWGAFVGSPIERQSLKFYWLEECIDGENLFVAGTYKKILERVAKPALEGAEVRYGQQVKRVVFNDETEEVSPVKVELVDGQSLEFDEVVMTTPLGWLKRNKDAFVPPLPQRLNQAIDNIGYGCLDKFYITFPTAFWDGPASTPNDAIPTGARRSVPNTTATTHPLRQPSFNEENQEIDTEHHPGFTQWTGPTYSETNPEGWNQECVNMAALPATTAHPTLLFYTFGPTSQHLASLLANDPDPYQPSPTTSAALFSFFEPYYSRLPNYSRTSPSCKPVGVLATAWTNDELAGYGSYCNFQVGLERGDEDIEVLRKGVPERRVWLVGEHTASFLALGTVTGAYWSGEGVGRLIVKAYGGNEKV